MRITKQAVEIGNGAAVYVPREYAGKEVIVILPEGITEIKLRILQKLVCFMPNILGAYLFGSYARGEQKTESDIDLLIITKEKDDKIKKAFNDIDARVITLEEARKSIENSPLLIMPILKESETLINPLLLEELQNSKIKFEKFKWNFDDIKRVVKIIETFIELDDKNISISHVYSLVMRLRVCFLIECILKDKKFSNLTLKSLLIKKGLKEKEVEKFFNIYRLIRDDENAQGKIDKEEILPLIDLVKNYSKEVENETQKEIRKRH